MKIIKNFFIVAIGSYLINSYLYCQFNPCYFPLVSKCVSIVALVVSLIISKSIKDNNESDLEYYKEKCDTLQIEVDTLEKAINKRY